MKIITCLNSLILASLLSPLAHSQETTNPPPAAPVEMRALQIEYFGGFTGFDAGGFQLLKAAIGSMIADGTLGTFTTNEIGKAGGGSFCVMMSPYHEKNIEDVMSVLTSLKPADGVTVYRLNKLEKCSDTQL